MSEKLKLFTDGGSRGNPGIAGCGFVVYRADLPTEASAKAEIILEKRGNYLGHMTNNQAEYEGLLRGLTWVVTNHPGCELEIYLDSLLIVNQLKGIFRVKNQALLPYFLRAQKLLKTLDSYSVTHIKRELNSVADALANEAMDQAHNL